MKNTIIDTSLTFLTLALIVDIWFVSYILLRGEPSGIAFWDMQARFIVHLFVNKIYY